MDKPSNALQTFQTILQIASYIVMTLLPAAVKVYFDFKRQLEEVKNRQVATDTKLDRNATWTSENYATMNTIKDAINAHGAAITNVTKSVTDVAAMVTPQTTPSVPVVLQTVGDLPNTTKEVVNGMMSGILGVPEEAADEEDLDEAEDEII